MKISKAGLMDSLVRKTLELLPPELVNDSVLVVYAPGEMITIKDAEIQFAYALLEGTADAFNETYDGKRSVWLELRPLSFLSDVEILAGRNRYITNVAAQTEVVMLKFKASLFREQLQKNNRFLWDVSSRIADNSCSIFLTHGITGFCSNLDKTALYLLRFCKAQPPAEGSPLVIRETRDQISCAALVSPRTLDRCLRQLKEEGFISLVHGKIQISAAQYQKLHDNWHMK